MFALSRYEFYTKMTQKVPIFIYYVANLYLFPIKIIRHIYFIVY